MEYIMLHQLDLYVIRQPMHESVYLGYQILSALAGLGVKVYGVVCDRPFRRPPHRLGTSKYLAELHCKGLEL